MKRKIQLLCFLAMALSFCQDIFAQNGVVENDTLFNSILTAHRKYKAVSDKNVEKVVDMYGMKSDSFAAAMNNDAVVQEKRAMINTLANNLNNLSPEKYQEAMKVFEQYIVTANVLDSKSDLSSKTVKDLSAKFKKDIVKTKNEFPVKDAKSGKMLRLDPNNHLDLNVIFSPPAKDSNYIIYLFPIWWTFDALLLNPCIKDNWKNISQCYDLLDRHAHKWVKGKPLYFDRISTGDHMLLLIEKKTNKVIYSEVFFIPRTDNIFKFNL
jgi:hypothetical protein